MKFNQTNVGSNKTVNHEGQVAYKMKNKEKLATMVLTSFFNEAKFYGDNSAELVQLLKDVIKEDALFVSQLAVYSRRVFNMRSISQVLTAYLAHEAEGKQYVKRTVRGICLRGDDITELMAYYIATFGKPIPNSLRKAVNTVLQGLNEYELAKYKCDKKAVSMKDLLCICHPAPLTQEQSDLWKRCIEGKLAVPYTWETELSEKGNTKEVWEHLIDSGCVGYMALLRNLRNIILSGASNLDVVLDIIADPERVRKSKQLPFRYLSAYNVAKQLEADAQMLRLLGECTHAVSVSSKVFTALEKAVRVSAENLPKLKGKTVIAIDRSGSMSKGGVGGYSNVTPVQIASVLGLLTNIMCEDSLVYLFNQDIETLGVSEYTPVLETASKIQAYGGTIMSLPITRLKETRIKANRIIYISDNECSYMRQSTMQYLNEYLEDNPDCWVHAIDVEGYGTQQFKGDRVNVIAGWSDKVIEFINLAELGVGNLMTAIQAYVF